jgi:hypothetical protein
VPLEERALVARELAAGIDDEARGDQLVGAHDQRIGGERLVGGGREPRAAGLRIAGAERRELSAERLEPRPAEQRVPRERVLLDGPRVAGDRGVLLAELLVEAREPVDALAGLERAAVLRQRLEPRAGGRPLAEEVVR